MRKRMLKRILSLILSMVVVFTSIPQMPVEVHAETAGVATVADENEFMTALSDASVSVIQLANDITLARSADGKDNVFVIPRAVTITDGSLTLERAGIILGGAVTFENTAINFANPVRNAIVANGHPLTLSDVTTAGTYNVDIFCGGISNYTGGNDTELPAAGVASIVTIQGTNNFTGTTGINSGVAGGNIFAGNLSDVGADAGDVANSYAGSANITIANGATGVGKIYAHGARENRTGGAPDAWSANAGLYSVAGGVTVNLNSVTNVTVDGATGSAQNAAFIYTDNGTGYQCAPSLTNVASISLLPSNTDTANLAPYITGEVKSVSVPENTELSLINTNGVLSVESFAGGGTVVLPENTGKLTVTNVVSGTTKVAVKGVSADGTNSTGTIANDYTLVSYLGNASEYGFVLLPNSNKPNMYLFEDEAGNWKTAVSESEILINSIGNIENVSVSAQESAVVIVPIEVEYTFPEKDTNYLMDIEMSVFVDGQKVDGENSGMGYTYPTDEMSIFFAIGENDEEVLRIESIADVIPVGEYKIDITIPAEYMANGSDYTTSFTLTVSCNHAAISSTTGKCAVCGELAAPFSVTRDGTTKYYDNRELFSRLMSSYVSENITIDLYQDVEYNHTQSTVMDGKWVLNLNGNTMVGRPYRLFYIGNDFIVNGPGAISGSRNSFDVYNGNLQIGGEEAPTLSTILLNNTDTCSVQINTELEDGQYEIKVENALTTADPVVEMNTPAFLKGGDGIELSKDWFTFHHSNANYCYEVMQDENNDIYFHVTGAAHTWENSICTVCNYTCTHENCENSKCTLCGYECTNHTYDTTNQCTTCRTIKPIVLGDTFSSNYNLVYFKFVPKVSGTYILNAICGDDGTVNIIVFNENGDRLATTSISSPGERLEYAYTDGETYIISVENPNGIQYSLDLLCAQHNYVPTADESGIVIECAACDEENNTMSLEGGVYDSDNQMWWGKAGDTLTMNAPDGYTIVKGEETPAASISLGSQDSKEIRLIDTSTGIEGAIDVSNLIKWDATAPETKISDGDNSWETIEKAVSYAHFYTDEKTITITATDAETGIASIEYVISDIDLIDDDINAESLGAHIESKVSNWLTYNNSPVALSCGGKYIIYAKITDNVGNVTYVNSVGLVIYNESTVADTTVSRVYKSDETVSIAYTLNGNTLSKLSYGDTELVKGTDYTVDEANSKAILADSWLDTLGAGNHTITIAFAPVGVETSAVSLTKDVVLSIEKANIANVEIEMDTAWDYNGAPITPEMTLSWNSYALVEDTDYTLSYSNNTLAGTATITITGNGNFAGTKEVTFTITDTTAPKIRMDIEGNIFTDILDVITLGHFYKDGVDVKVTADGTGSAVAKVEYMISKESYANASLPTAGWTTVEKDAEGAYTFTVAAKNKGSVYVKVTDAGGNTAVVNSEGVVVYTDSVLTTTEVVYTKTTKTDASISLNLNENTVASVSEGDIVLTDEEYKVEGEKVVLFGTYLDTLALGHNTVTITVNPLGETYVESAKNDVPVALIVTILVNKAEDSVSITSDLTKVYDGNEPAAPEYTAKSTGAVKVEYKEKSASDDTYTTNAPVNAGTYMVRVSVEGDDNYKASSATKEFTIKQATLTVAGATAQTKEYDGTKAVAITDVVLNGIKGTDRVSIDIPKLTASVSSANVGEYTEVALSALALAGDDKDNYILSASTQILGLDTAVEITKKPITVTAQNISKLYGAADPAFTYTVAGLVSGETLTGTLSRESGEDTGNYNITQGTLTNENNSNYDITFVKGTLTIKEAPHIQNEGGKMGWDVIRDEVKDAKPGDTVAVDMNGSTEIAGDVIDEIKGKDITISFDMGNGITWSVNGKSVTSDNIADINMSVTVGTESNPIKNIPMKVINEVAGDNYHMEISLAHNGEFGFEAVLTMNLNAENAGLFANLYYYNPQSGELEFISEDEIAEDGTAELLFTHASDYTIVIKENEATNSIFPYLGFVTSPKTGEAVNYFVVILGLAACVYWINKKKCVR